MILTKGGDCYGRKIKAHARQEVRHWQKQGQRWLLALFVVGSFVKPSTAGAQGMVSEPRNPAVRRAFMTQYGMARVPKGCQIDHCTPLMCQGADALQNLQLICGKEMDAKERAERFCTLHFVCKSEAENRETLKQALTPRKEPHARGQRIPRH